MKYFGGLKRFMARMLAVGIVGGAAATLVAFNSAGALSIDTPTDCDSNAVVYCGAKSTSSLQSKYTNGDGKNSAASIHNIFSYFTISSSDISSIGSTAVAGTVTKSGNVVVNGEVVATGAMTAGRTNMSGSTKVTYNGTTFYKRAPSVSFASDNLKAYVVMSGGKFDYAVLASCGNPVVATPKAPKLPNYTVAKTVRVKGTSTWAENVSVKSGTHVEYRVVVSGTGQVAAKNVTVKDTLPTGVTYVAGTLKRDSTALTSNNFFGSGDVIATLNPSSSVTYIFEAVVGAKDTETSCTAQSLTNTSTISSSGLPNKSDTAVVNKTCQAPKPAAKCDTLTLSKNNREVTAVVKYTASGGATLKNIAYNFGDNSSVVNTTQTTQKHTYATDGTFKVTATLTFNATSTVPASTCEANVTIATTTPSYSCDLLDIEKGSDRTVKISAFQTSASGGATFKEAVIDWGDSSNKLTTTSPVGQTHSYNEDKSYTVTAVARFTLPGGTESTDMGKCSATVSFTTTPPPTTPQVLPAETVAQPTQLTHVGPAGVVGVFAGTSVLGSLAYYWFAARRMIRG